LGSLPAAPKVAAASLPSGADENARTARAAIAAHEVLASVFPDQRAALDAALEKSLASAPASGRAAALAEGRAIGAAGVTLRWGDGSDLPNVLRPVTTAGKYVPTTMPVGSRWGSVKPWTLRSGDQFRPPPPPALSSKQWADDYNEIATLGGKSSTKRTAEQTEAARFWTVVGPASYLPIVHALSSRSGGTLVQIARLYALVSIAVADSYIAVLDAKYAYWFWRPITAIRNGDEDHNPATARDEAWEPLIDTPMHPEYPCAHCINWAAAAGVLQSEFGGGKIGPFGMTSPTAPGVKHSWDSIWDWQAEVSNARIWGGLHYHNSTVVGTAMGKRIAEQ